MCTELLGTGEALSTATRLSTLHCGLGDEGGTGTGLARRAHAQIPTLAIDDLLGSCGPTQGRPIPLVARKDCPLVGGSFPEGRTLLMLRVTSGTLLDQSEVTVTGGDRGQWSEAQVWLRVWFLFQRVPRNR